MTLTKQSVHGVTYPVVEYCFGGSMMKGARDWRGLERPGEAWRGSWRGLERGGVGGLARDPCCGLFR